MNPEVSTIDWKEVGITATVTFVTALIGCTIAVVLANKVIIPAMEKAAEKKDSDKK